MSLIQRKCWADSYFTISAVLDYLDWGFRRNRNRLFYLKYLSGLIKYVPIRLYNRYLSTTTKMYHMVAQFYWCITRCYVVVCLKTSSNRSRVWAKETRLNFGVTSNIERQNVCQTNWVFVTAKRGPRDESCKSLYGFLPNLNSLEFARHVFFVSTLT